MNQETETCCDRTDEGVMTERAETLGMPSFVGGAPGAGAGGR